MHDPPARPISPVQVPVLEYPVGTADSVAVHDVVPSLLNPVTVKLAGVASDADPDPGLTFAPGQDRLTVTEPAGLLGTKSFDTVNVAEFNVFDDRDDPPARPISPVQVPVLEYPVGTADSVAVHDVVPSLLNPVTVKLAGVASDADPDPGRTFVPGQDRLTVTEPAGLLGTKSFDTVNVAEFNVLTIVHDPPARPISPVQVPVLEYPVGTADSVVVHDVVPSLLNPVTVKLAGVASDADPDPGLTFAPGQDRLTVTEPAGLLGTKSFDTVNVAEFNVLTIVHDPPARPISPVQVPVLE